MDSATGASGGACDFRRRKYRIPRTRMTTRAKKATTPPTMAPTGVGFEVEGVGSSVDAGVDEIEGGVEGAGGLGVGPWTTDVVKISGG